jgi:endogenous inhibitor of DNA gyrase (YacG/DUF329 family)
MTDPNPPIYRVTEKSLVEPVGKVRYAKHRDGGLYPLYDEDRGDLDIPCPDCGNRLVRNINAESWERAVVRCPSCDGVFAGTHYPFTDRVK